MSRLIGRNLIQLSGLKALNKLTGEVKEISKFSTQQRLPFIHKPISITREIEVLESLDEKKIDLFLYDGNKRAKSQNGFLIEVFLSGSDGKLDRVYKDKIVDETTDDVVVDTFSKYLDIKFDVEE